MALAAACATTAGRGGTGSPAAAEPQDQGHALWLLILGEQAQTEQALERLGQPDGTTCAGVCAPVGSASDLAGVLCDFAGQHAGREDLASLCRDGRSRARLARTRAQAAGCPCSE